MTRSCTAKSKWSAVKKKLDCHLHCPPQLGNSSICVERYLKSSQGLSCGPYSWSTQLKPNKPSIL
eukprot:3527742-Amphidinium_carterae.1